MSITLAGRTVDGVEIPAAGTWKIDPAHSVVGFTARHLMVAKVRGSFGSFSGAVTLGERPEDSHAEVSIDAASIDTREPQRDEHLRSADFLDVDTYPTLEFVSTGFRETGGTTFELAGDLTIRDTTRPVVLAAEFGGLGADPWGNTRAFFSARTELNREDWGLTWNQFLESGGVVVGKKVAIELEISAVYQA